LRACGWNGNLAPVDVPDLRALQRGDPDAWDEAFRWLWPAAFAVAQLKLKPFLPGDVEDVAIEALEELVEKVREVAHVEELKPLAASIAHHRAVSRLRERFAKKRGAGQTESLEALQDEDRHPPESADGTSPVAALAQSELADLLAAVQSELKPDQRAVLGDFFIQGLSYEEIAKKRGLAMGSVGVYLKRGLEAIRKLGARHPKLMTELEAFLR
jgi:RNA polymerase sigma factor (sigma-70 family)